MVYIKIYLLFVFTLAYSNGEGIFNGNFLCENGGSKGVDDSKKDEQCKKDNYKIRVENFEIDCCIHKVTHSRKKFHRIFKLMHNGSLDADTVSLLVYVLYNHFHQLYCRKQH